ncbi:MAG TPA: hypothetical protein VGI17_01145 [Solirubrobacterales bacterium]|jgi:hypothetical protein
MVKEMQSLREYVSKLIPAGKPQRVALALGLTALAFAALPAIASANISLREGSGTGTKIVVGKAVTIKSSNLVFSTTGPAVGNVECSNSTLSGHVSLNGAPQAKIQITSAAFKGAEEGALERCKTTIAGPIRPLTAEVSAVNLAWISAFEQNGTSTTEGLSRIVATTGSVGLRSKLFAEVSKGVVAQVSNCVYEKESVAGTFTIGNALGDLISAPEFALNAGASTGECPSGGTLSGTGTVEASGGVSVFTSTP